MKTKQKIGFSGFGSFGDKFGRIAGVFNSRAQAAQKKGELEEAARQVGADLADPEQFRVVQELIAK